MTQEEHLESSHQPSNSVYDQVGDDSDKSKNNTASNQLGCARSCSISEKTDTADRALVSGDKVVGDIEQGGQAVDHSGKSKDEPKSDQNNNNPEMTVISHQNSGENIREIQTEIENSKKSTCGGVNDCGENTEVVQKVGDNSQDIPSKSVSGNEEKKGASDEMSPKSVEGESEETEKIAKTSDEDDPFARLRALKANISNVLNQVKAVLTEHGVDTQNEPDKEDIKPAEENAIRFRFIRRIRKRSVFDENEKKEAIENKDPPAVDVQTKETMSPSQEVQPQSESNEEHTQDIPQPNDDKRIGHAKEHTSSEKSETTTNDIKIVSAEEAKVSSNIVNKTKEVVTSEIGETSQKAQSQEIKDEIEFHVKIVEIQNNIQQYKDVTNSSNNAALSTEVTTTIQPEPRVSEPKKYDAESLEIKDETITELSSTTEESLDSSLSIGPEYEVKVVDVISVSELPAPSSASSKQIKEGERSQKKALKSKTKTTPKIETPSTEKFSVKTKRIKGDAETPKKKERKSSLTKDGAKLEPQLDEKKKATTKTKGKKLEGSNKEILPTVTEVITKTLVPIDTKTVVTAPSKVKILAPKKELIPMVADTTTKSPTKPTTPFKTPEAAPPKEIITKTQKEEIGQKIPEKSALPLKQDQLKPDPKTKKTSEQNEKAKIEISEKVSPDSKESSGNKNSVSEETKTSQDKTADIQKVNIPKDKIISNSSTSPIPKESSLSEKHKSLPKLEESEEKKSEIKEVKTSSSSVSPTIPHKVEEKPPIVPLISKVEEKPHVPQETVAYKTPSNAEKEIVSNVTSLPKSVPTSALEKVLATTNLKLIVDPRPPVVPQKSPPTDSPKPSTEKIATPKPSPPPINLDNENIKNAKTRQNSLPAAIPSDVTQSQAIATSSSKDEKFVLKPDPSQTSSQQNPTVPIKELRDHDDKSTPQISKEVTEKKNENKISEKAEEKKSVDKVPLKIESNKIRTVSIKPTLTLLPSPVKAVQLAPKKLELVPVPKASQLAVVQVQQKKDKAVVVYQPKDEEQKDDASQCDATSIPSLEGKVLEQLKEEEVPESPVLEKTEKLDEDEKPEETSGKKLGPKKRKMKKKVVIKRIRRRLSTDGTISTRKDSVDSAELEICEKIIDGQPEKEPEPEPEPEEEKPPPGPKSCLKIREYQPGDIVMYADRIKKIVKWKKAEVLERITSISYKLNVEGEEKSCHICYIKKYTGKKVQFGGKEYLEIDYAQEESSDEEVYDIWSRV